MHDIEESSVIDTSYLLLKEIKFSKIFFLSCKRKKKKFFVMDFELLIRVFEFFGNILEKDREVI